MTVGTVTVAEEEVVVAHAAAELGGEEPVGLEVGADWEMEVGESSSSSLSVLSSLLVARTAWPCRRLKNTQLTCSPSVFYSQRPPTYNQPTDTGVNLIYFANLQ
jgi:hypothetical protein